jgi:hypothetical protein
MNASFIYVSAERVYHYWGRHLNIAGAMENIKDRVAKMGGVRIGQRKRRD